MADPVRIFLLTLLLMLSACGADGGGGESSGNSGSQSQQQPTAKSLSIQPIAQEEPDWCYAASTQMIFAYYRLPAFNPDYQCGIVAVFNANSYPACFLTCQYCAQIGGGTMDAIQQLVDGYGVVANENGVPSPVLTSAEVYSYLSMQQVEAEIDAGRPILAGISPGQYPLPDQSQHAVVIVGYNTTGSTPLLIVNDPFPYAATFQQDPYTPVGGALVRPGQYSISYDAFVQYLVWANTLYQIRVAQN
jgi:hypothetical protein